MFVDGMPRVFIGSEAMAAGRLTKWQLRRWHRPIFPGVYVDAALEVSLRDRTVGAWLWSRRRGVIAGLAASALHGAQWVDADVAIELISDSARPHAGLVVRNEALAPDEVTRAVGLPVTTRTRTAFDLARHLERGEAVARLDALAYSQLFSVEDVLLLAKRYPGARGLRRLSAALPLVDAGAASPKETWLRLLLIDAGFPVPATQIPVVDGWRVVGYLDMGWEQFRVAAEYDGDHHRTVRSQYVRDMRRLAAFERLGWIVVRVIAEDRPSDVISRVGEALSRRGYRGFR
jgi:hypothetical protein